MRAFRSLFSLASVCAVAVFVGCSSTRIASVWMDPEVRPAPFQKVLVAVIGRDQDLRHIAEDTFVNSLSSNAQGVPSYTLFPGDRMPELSEVRAAVAKMGADGVVVYRVVGVDKVESYAPGVATPYPSYGSFESYWSYAVPVAYESGYLVEDEIVRVETNAFSVAQETLVWSAQSETLNPGSAELLIDEVVLATTERMRKDKILP